MDVEKICKKMVKISTTSKEDSYISKLIRSIVSGGDSSFTNKVDQYGMVKDFSYANNNPMHLFARSLKLCKFMEELDIDIFYKFPIKLYRSVNLKELPRHNIIQPLPFSTTWNRTIALDWTDLNCSLFEITVKFGTILPLSIPSEVDHDELKRISLNQVQEEVVLPPCRLKLLSRYQIQTIDKNVDIIECEAIRLTPKEMIEFYPEKYKNTLYKSINSIGWVDEKLLQYYDVEDMDDEIIENIISSSDEDIPEWM
jgi:hypothetical protein